ncbi:MAG: hypothetical protein M1831_006328 [Alyxoria varia]|nr:MAG: hypothetical protein M1831_006328 [Alyxoria varia]
MASDDVVWQIINNQMCSFKLKTSKDQTFCRNEYNATGLCGRQTCPLANSRYATIRSDPEDPSKLYLYTKTIERAHLPSRLWERQELSRNYQKAIEQIDSVLAYFPKFLIHKCKQRLTRLTQTALRMRRLAKEEARLGERIVPKLAPKIRKREATRERKAEQAAKVEKAIERELVERLRSGAYGDNPLNVEENMWKKVLKGLEKAGEAHRDKDLDEGIEEEDQADKEMEQEHELELDDGGNVEYVSDIEGESDEEDLEDWDNGEDTSGQSELSGDDEEPEDPKDVKLKGKMVGKKRKMPSPPPLKPNKRSNAKGPKTTIEYEVEDEPPMRVPALQ